MTHRTILGLICIGTALTQLAQAQVTVDIHVYDFDFGTADHVHENPTIHPGDTVEWIWDNGTHSTTSAAGQTESWNSGLQSTGFTFDHTFTQTGTFNYYCMMHGSDLGGGNVGGMSGSIIVTPVPEPAQMGLAAGSVLVAYATWWGRKPRRLALGTSA
jgi:plastocyanin